MSRKKKVVEEPVEEVEMTPAPEAIVEEIVTPAEPVVEEETDGTQPSEPAASAPKTAYEIATAIREDIKRTIDNSPKRNDATTMPAIVNLRCRTGDFHFMMPQFDAKTVGRLWDKYKNTIEPEQFVAYLYTTMGLNPPKLYMFMDIINIS